VSNGSGVVVTPFSGLLTFCWANLAFARQARSTPGFNIAGFQPYEFSKAGGVLKTVED